MISLPGEKGQRSTELALERHRPRNRARDGPGILLYLANTKGFVARSLGSVPVGLEDPPELE
jgi:hypothetical protein